MANGASGKLLNDGAPDVVVTGNSVAVFGSIVAVFGSIVPVLLSVDGFSVSGGFVGIGVSGFVGIGVVEFVASLSA